MESQNTSTTPTAATSSVSTAPGAVSSTLPSEVLAAIQVAVANAVSQQQTVIHSPFSTPSVVHRLPSASGSSIPAFGSSGGPSTVAFGGGRFPAVPSFLNTFSMPRLAGSVRPPSSLGSTFTTGLWPSPSSSLFPISSTLYKPFVVGPGYSPVPAKLVSNILAGKFVDLNDLLPANLHPLLENESQLMLDGRLILTSQPKRPTKRFDDIVSWIEAFSIFSLVLCSSFPHRWNDLQLYKLLINRTNRLFGGSAWLTYDQAFREHAAATSQTDWSQMHAQLYSFHTAGAPAKSSSTYCISWNKGHCSSYYRPCKYAHKCSKCYGNHRAAECSKQDRSAEKSDRDGSPKPSRKYRKL